MSQFEFILIIISIVAGIAMSEMLASVSRAMSGGKLTLRTAPFYLATIFLLFQATRYVWVLWDYRSVQWEFWNFMLLLLPVMAIAIAAHVFAVPRGNDVIDLEGHYFSRAPLFYSLMCILMVLWAIFDLVNLSHITEVSTQENFILIRFGAIALGLPQFAWLAYTERVSHHWVILVLAVIYLVYRTFQSVPALLGQ